MAHVHAVTENPIDGRLTAGSQWRQPTGDTTPHTQKLTAKPGSVTDSEPAGTRRQRSTRSSPRSKDSKPRWQEPRTVDQLAAQINSIATRVLNGEIDMDTARTYSTLARVIAQTISMRVTKARFLKTAPDLNIGETD